LDSFKEKMKEKGWDHGQDDEELFEYAMHPTQYEDFKSGAAKKKFEADLADRKAKANGGNTSTAGALPVPVGAGGGTGVTPMPRNLTVNVNGTNYNVGIEYPDQVNDNTAQTNSVAAAVPVEITAGDGHLVTSPLEGKFFLTKSPGEQGLKVGDTVAKGDTVAYVESMKVVNSITTSEGGTVNEIYVSHGDDIEEDQPLIRIV